MLNLRRERERYEVLSIDQRATDGGLFVVEGTWLQLWNEFTAEGAPTPVRPSSL